MPNHVTACCNTRITTYGQLCNCGHVWTESRFGQLGINLLDGDLTVGLGNGLVLDTGTGEVELEIAPGIDIPLGGDFF